MTALHTRQSTAELVQDWLSERLGRELIVTGLDRIPGGASMETWRVRCGDGSDEGYVLRKSPPGALLDTQRDVEYAAYASFFGTEVPVPAPIGLETSPELLGAPFFVAAEVRGCEADGKLLDQEPWRSVAHEIGVQFWTILGDIARTDPATTALAAVLPPATVTDSAAIELAHWSKVLRDDEICADPLAAAAMAALAEGLPMPPERVAIVHGDYRTGNVLFDRSGRLRAVLDWEMCHLGDPLEDVAWALSPLWASADGIPGRMIGRDAALAHWEASSGLRVDRRSLAWWELFNALKGTAIWASAAHRYATGTSKDLLLAQVPWAAGVRQEVVLARALRTFLTEGS